MKKEAVIGTAALLILVGGTVIYAAFRPIPPVPGQMNVDSQYYTVTASWPTTTPLAQTASPAASAAAVALMQQDIEGGVAQFVSSLDVASITPAEAQFYGLSPTNKYSLTISYEATSSPATISYIFTVYYNTLGAHPNVTYATYTFDSATGKQLGPGDLFQNGFIDGTLNPAVADELSQIARAQLPPIIANQQGTSVADVDQEMLDAGTTADLTNFLNLYLANGDLVFIFPPYAVGPFALGTVTLALPLSSVPNLEPEYR